MNMSSVSGRSSDSSDAFVYLAVTEGVTHRDVQRKKEEIPENKKYV